MRKPFKDYTWPELVVMANIVTKPGTFKLSGDEKEISAKYGKKFRHYCYTYITGKRDFWINIKG